MKRFIYLAGAIGGAFLMSLGVIGFNAVVHAQEPAGVWRVQVHEYTPPPELSFWQSVGRFLAGKAYVSRPEVGTTFTVQSSAYAPSPYQTDATPCITAAGTRVRKGVVATNFLPMGTLLRINGGIYIVEDRMNPRYRGYYIDLWFSSTAEALAFGRQNLEVEIVGYGVPGQRLVDPNNPPEVFLIDDIEPGFFERTGQTLRRISRGIGSLIGANVNQFDIDCFSEVSAANK